MSQNSALAPPPLQTALRELGGRLADIRLSRNLTQAQLANEAGVSLSSIKRLEAGQNTSLDTFLRVLRALGLTNHLATVLPDPTVRPVERVQRQGRQRQRARPGTAPPAAAWTWDDAEGTWDDARGSWNDGGK